MDDAASRLKAALDRLESTLDGFLARSGDPAMLRRELGTLVDDRARLAEELDAALAREKELQLLADEASAALGSAIEEVRAALGSQEA